MTLPAGQVIHRICPNEDVDIPADHVGPSCPRCGSKLVEIRAERDDVLGTVIDDRFEIREKVGQGGMGTVYRAWQRSVGREVAIKLIDRSFSRDPMSVRRFLREARLASQLSQPNTVSVFDFGQAADGRLFIAMELIRGRTLHRVVSDEGAFSVERAVRIGVQICDALEAAHGAGIIHRDLKLENAIVLDHPPGRDLLKVLDFGLAKNIDEPGSRGTESGIVVGTPRYLAPEVATTGRAGPPADLYALGVMLGELVLGKELWQGESLAHLVAQKLDPRPAIAGVPGPLHRVVSELLDPEPERRPNAEQTRALLLASQDPNAGDTVIDDRAGSTVSLRGREAPTQNLTQQPTVTTGISRRAAARTPVPGDPSPSMEELARPPRRNPWPWIALGVLVGVLGVVAFALGRRGGESHASAARPGDAQVAVAVDAAFMPPQPADAAVPMVTVRVDSRPQGAHVLHDGKIDQTPFTLAVPEGSSPITLRATLAGYQTWTRTIVPDREHEITIPLRPAHRADDDSTTPF